jgi:hypothetical protein
MKENEEQALRTRLLREESARVRELFNYTYDALPHLMTYPLSHEDVKKVISGELNYDTLLVDDDEIENEGYKGFAFKDQAKIVKRNLDKEPLCEAFNMQPCKKEECPLYIAPGSKDSEGKVITEIPLCREFKMAFRK